MKNQYFGDINDYRKYGLLRALQDGGKRRLLVAWMLTPDDGSTDGQKRAYLDEPDGFRRFDPKLFDTLRLLTSDERAPAVELIEATSLLAPATFHSLPVPDGRREREEWHRSLLQAVRSGEPDLVFFDPDNGVEVRSKPVGRRGSSKYVRWAEIEAVWGAGCSVLVYQHFPRVRRDEYTVQLTAEVRRRLGARCSTWAFATSHVLFVLAARPSHRAGLAGAIEGPLGRWSGQIEVLPPAP
jgi:hypothetical protein